ncbi:MAG: glycoside hydrolase family 32 protein, partial [Turicibacter sp.]
LGRMWECPDLFELDGQDVLLMSPQQMHNEEFRYKNGNTTVYFIGEFNYETGKLNKHSYDEIDYGLDFYAPQTTLAPDGRRIMMAWMQSWDRNIPSDKFGWTSSMTLPRELKVKNNKLYQLPVKEIEDYRCDYVKYETVELCESQSFPSIRGRQLELKIKVDLCEAHSFTIKAMKAVQEETTISFDTERSVLCFDRSRSGSGIDQNKPLNRREMPITIANNTLELRIFIDTYAIEIFVQDGEYAMSSTVYSNLESDGIEFESDGKVIMELEKWSLKGAK